MNLQLHSIDHAPGSLPIWQTIIDDLGNPPPARVARVLGIGERTVYRYNQTGNAPKIALLALFWLTRWGRSSVHAQASNDAMVAIGYVRALQAQVGQLEVQVAKLTALGGFGSANDPLLTAPSGGLGGTPR